MNLMIIFAIFIFSTLSNAAETGSFLSSQKVQSSTLSDREILKKLYDTATSSASSSDFDKIDGPKTLKCAVAVRKHKALPCTESFVQMDILVKPPIPSRGPLLPALPAVYERKLIPFPVESTSPIANYYTTSLQNNFARENKVYKDLSDLIIVQKLPDYPGPGMEWAKGPLYDVQYHTKYRFRRNGDLLAFKLVSLSFPEFGENYGYCWR